MFLWGLNIDRAEDIKQVVTMPKSELLHLEISVTALIINKSHNEKERLTILVGKLQIENK